MDDYLEGFAFFEKFSWKSIQGIQERSAAGLGV